MMFFWFFPFSILIPFLAISLFIRIIATYNRNALIGRRRGRLPEAFQSIPGLSRKSINAESSNDDFEVYIYRLAARHKGRLSTAQIVVDSGLTTKQVEDRMNAFIDNVHIRMEVSDDGRIFYEFPGLEEE